MSGLEIPKPAAVVAVPFAGGVLMGGGPVEGRASIVLKLPWGLLAGADSEEILLEAQSKLAERSRRSPGEIADILDALGPGDRESAWLFSYEPIGPLGDGVSLGEGHAGNSVVRLFRVLPESGAVEVGWGALDVVGDTGESDLHWGMELRLHRALDRGRDLDSRVAALRQCFLWLAAEAAASADRSAHIDVDLGIHEPGQHFAVDRVGWTQEKEEEMGEQER